MAKVVEFFQTDKGYIAKVDGVLAWFIRDEPRLRPNEGWYVYKYEDCGEVMKLIPAKCRLDENGELMSAEKWGHATLKDAKAFVYNQELSI